MLAKPHSISLKQNFCHRPSDSSIIVFENISFADGTTCAHHCITDMSDKLRDSNNKRAIHIVFGTETGSLVAPVDNELYEVSSVSQRWTMGDAVSFDFPGRNCISLCRKLGISGFSRGRTKILWTFPHFLHSWSTSRLDLVCLIPD
jgi:hypothetical protein